jgi:N-acetylglucosaminyldiphosphoundecaprenol N-acetyl-beta-D-mannosaminyltransferase
MGLRLHALSQSDCVVHVMRELASSRPGWVLTVNLDILRRWRLDGEFRSLVEGATLRLADGMPLVWASRIAGEPLPERVAGSDLIWSLSQAAAQDRRSLYLLGGNPGSAAAAAGVLAERYPGLRISGTHCPPMGFESDPAQLRAIHASLLLAQPDLVLVALGSPKQDRLIAQLRPLLPRAWWVGVGISFSFVSGEVRRAPAWARRCGLEWLHRLTQEPGRLARRYLVHGLAFAARLFAWALAARLWSRRKGKI